MAKIQAVDFPLNIGTATELEIYISANSVNNDAKITYFLLDTNKKRLSNGSITLSQIDYETNGTDLVWLMNYTASQIGAILI